MLYLLVYTIVPILAIICWLSAAANEQHNFDYWGCFILGGLMFLFVIYVALEQKILLEQDNE